MALKRYKPTSPARRQMSSADFSGLTASTPKKSLLSSLKSKSGRNVYGRITMRRRGGGHKRRYRLVDFKRDKFGVPAVVKSLEYDPNRTARIALVSYMDGEYRYILAPDGLSIGDAVISSKKADIQPGNSLPLQNIPVGTFVHNVELKIGAGGALCRAAGVSAQILSREGSWCLLRLPSGEVRRVHTNCRATVGRLSNSEHSNLSLGKAGRSRWLGRRPKVRGVVMNPVDHPHGGGEGRTSGGRHPVTPWGVPTKGKKTRKNRRTDVFIVSRRK